jgi:16S rRNA (guanine966-N2)-methyltransferase
MIRLTGGERKGMALHTPRGRQTRPATARIRQWLFDVLAPPGGQVVLDLFAGSGAVGLEALSRGAHSALFVEQGEEAVRVLRRNLEKARYNERSQVWSSPVEAAVRQLLATGRRFDLVFCDPPYAYRDLERLLAESVLALLDPGGTLVVEHRGDRPLLPGGHQPDRVKDFGETRISIWTVV